MASQQPLEGVRVIDCARLVAGPLSATFMGDFGAEVVKVEHPDFGDPTREWGESEEELTWKWIGRNKKSVTIDLHSEDGQRLFKELITDADILVESFRPKTLERWNIGWETLSEVNPNLIMIRTTGFGQDGPHSDRAGFGSLSEVMSGFAYLNGQPDGPPTLPPIPLADSIAALYSTFSSIMALYWRDMNDGRGQYIDTSLVEPLLGLMGDQLVEYDAEGLLRDRIGSRSQYTAPRNIYPTQDDEWVTINCSTNSTLLRLFEVMGREDLLDDGDLLPRFATDEARKENNEELDEIIREWTASNGLDELVDVFNNQDITGAPVYQADDILDDPHFRARDSIITVEDDDIGEVAMTDAFPKLSETPGGVRFTGPKLGQHTREVLLKNTSIEENELQDLVANGTISIPE